jgi:hypothetical protein
MKKKSEKIGKNRKKLKKKNPLPFNPCHKIDCLSRIFSLQKPQLLIMGGTTVCSFNFICLIQHLVLILIFFHISKNLNMVIKPLLTRLLIILSIVTSPPT